MAQVGPHSDAGHESIAAELVRVTMLRSSIDAAPELVHPLADDAQGHR